MVQHSISSLFTAHSLALLAATLCLSFAAQAQAQTQTQTQPQSAIKPTAKADPLDPQASVPALIYQSPFTQYRSLGSQELISWREANENVARIGGWRVYLRQAQQPVEPQNKP